MRTVPQLFAGELLAAVRGIGALLAMVAVMHRLGELVLVALLVWGIPGGLHAQALKRAGQAVRGEERREPQPRERDRDSPHVYRAPPARSYVATQRWDDADGGLFDEEEDDDHDENNGISFFFYHVVLSPWTLPAALLTASHPHGYSMPSYPYSDETAYTVAEDPAESTQPKWFMLRLQAAATARSPQLISGALAAQVDFANRIALRLDYRVLGEAVGGERYYAGLGNLEALYRFAESRSLRFFTGIGYVQWADALALGHGLGVIYGFEAYPFRPISFGSRVSFGPLGKSYGLQWRSHIGVMISRYEVQVAYDHLDVGGAQLGGLQLSVAAHL